MCARNRFTGSAFVLTLPWCSSSRQGGDQSCLFLSCSSSNGGKTVHNRSLRKLQSHQVGTEREGKEEQASLGEQPGHMGSGQRAHLWGSILILLPTGAGQPQVCLEGDTHQRKLSTPARWQGANTFATRQGGYLWARIFIFFLVGLRRWMKTLVEAGAPSLAGSLAFAITQQGVIRASKDSEPSGCTLEKNYF